MNIADLTPKAIEEAIGGFYNVVNKHVVNLVGIVANERYSIPRSHRRLGVAEFKYFFAADLDLLFRFALGGVNASNAHIISVCEKVELALFGTPGIEGTAIIKPAEFDDSVLGTAIRAAKARIGLRAEDDVMEMEEVVLLSGLTPQKIAGARMNAKKLKGKSRYPTEEVRAFFTKEGIRV